MKFIIGLVMLMLTVTSHAQWLRSTQNLKLPNQEVLDHYTVTPATAGASTILSANAGSGSASTATVSTFSGQPDVPRNIVVTPVGTTADVAAGNVVVNGRDANGNTITENLAFLANASTATTGSKAFKTITSIVFPGEDSPFGAQWDVGYGDKLGVNRCMDGAGYLIKGLVDGVVLTGTTVATSSTVVSDNTVIPNPAANGARKFDLLYIQNFRCK